MILVPILRLVSLLVAVGRMDTGGTDVGAGVELKVGEAVSEGDN